MALLFVPHKGNIQNSQDWYEASVIDDVKLNEFPPDGAVADGSSKIGTSIPSPLARLYLFEAAFGIVNNSSHAGISPYHQLVSDCFDMMELLFMASERDYRNGKLSFRQWSISRVHTNDNTARALIADTQHAGHTLVADALQIAFRSPDFANLHEITLIYWDGVLVGGTSPLTLFFTAPNWRRYCMANGVTFNFGEKYTLFDSKYEALAERSPEFAAYILTLFKGFRSAIKGSNFIKYLDRTINDSTNTSLRTTFNNLNEADAQAKLKAAIYSDIAADEKGTPLTVGLIPLKRVNQQFFRSDFFLQPTVGTHISDKLNGMTPLLLVQGMHITHATRNYVNTPFQHFNSLFIPEKDTQDDLLQRKIPSTEREYPCLYVGDFFSDKLVQLRGMQIDTTNFDYFGIKGFAEIDFLLPIRKTYFNYFTLQDLQKQLTITRENNNVLRFCLTLPVTNDTKNTLLTIDIAKRYTLTDATQRKQADINVAFYPFYKVSGKPEWNSFAAVCGYSNCEADLKFLDSAGKELLTANGQRSENTAVKSRHYRLDGQVFDMVEISCDGDAGLLFPKMKTYQADTLNKEFTVGIDFGTSNTHVALYDGKTLTPLVFEEQHTVKLSQTDGTLGDFKTVLQREFISNAKKITLPIRSVVCEVKTYEGQYPMLAAQGKESRLFRKINIGLAVNDESGAILNDHYESNLKWKLSQGINNIDSNRVDHLIEQLFWCAKHQIIGQEGNLDKVKVTWTFPQAMNSVEKENLEGALRQALLRVWSVQMSAKNVSELSESQAPLFYYYNSSGNQKPDIARGVLNIDIGGGTADVAYFMRDLHSLPAAFTSFKLAGNDLWSGSRDSEKDNTFLLRYLNDSTNGFNHARKQHISGQIIEILQKNADFGAEDLINALFQYDSDLGFTAFLRATPQRNLLLVLYVHYAATIYYLAQGIKKNGFAHPDIISFTGKGSSFIRLLFDGKANELKQFTENVYRQAYGTTDPVALEIYIEAQAKEVTANGAAYYAFTSQYPGGKVLVEKPSLACFTGKHDGNTLDFRSMQTIDLVSQPILTEVTESIKTFLQTIFIDTDATVQPLVKYMDLLVMEAAIKDAIAQTPAYTESAYLPMRAAKGNTPDTLFFLPFRRLLFGLGAFLSK